MSQLIEKYNEAVTQIENHPSSTYLVSILLSMREQEDCSKVKMLAETMSEPHYRYALDYLLSQSWFNPQIEEFLRPGFERSLSAPKLSSTFNEQTTVMASSALSSLILFNHQLLGHMPEKLSQSFKPYLLDVDFLKENKHLLREAALKSIIEAGIVDKKQFVSVLVKSKNKYATSLLEKMELEEVIAVPDIRKVHKL